MACQNLEIENGFLDALNNAKSYEAHNNVLTLSNDKKEITAKLEVAAKCQLYCCYILEGTRTFKNRNWSNLNYRWNFCYNYEIRYLQRTLLTQFKFRYSTGVTPVFCLKRRVKCCGYLNPKS